MVAFTNSMILHSIQDIPSCFFFKSVLVLYYYLSLIDVVLMTYEQSGINGNNILIKEKQSTQ